ncbi:hypothetical protein BDV19DRAFT_388112 [Aspergillus venezuelensis]
MISVTIGGLESGTSYSLHVTAVGGSGKLGSSSNTVTVSTKSLPGGKTITKYKVSPGTDSTTYTADILVPYALIRLYIWDSVACEFDSNPGWSVNFKRDEYVCTHYMVEGITLYKYSGTVPEGLTAPPWAWKSIGPITLGVEGYAYKWTLPIDTSTVNTGKFVIQAQGYNPLTNVFQRTLWHLSQRQLLGDQTRGCSVFIQGDNCRISGNDMWEAYQAICDLGWMFEIRLIPPG